MSLPGHRTKISEPAPCEDCGKPAVFSVQGETDSFGAEYHDLCRNCAGKFNPNAEGACDFCSTHSNLLKPTRDFEEGANGPVYYVCDPCINRRRERLNDDLDCYL